MALDAALVRVLDTGGVALVAEQEAQVAGPLFPSFETDGAYVREDLRRFAYVTDLFVREQNRRRGVATALLRGRAACRLSRSRTAHGGRAGWQ